MYQGAVLVSMMVWGAIYGAGVWLAQFVSGFFEALLERMGEYIYEFLTSTLYTVKYMTITDAVKINPSLFNDENVKREIEYGIDSKIPFVENNITGTLDYETYLTFISFQMQNLVSDLEIYAGYYWGGFCLIGMGIAILNIAFARSRAGYNPGDIA